MSNRKAKIVCTIGPASSSPGMVHRMIRAGMNVARLNFSHGTHETHKRAVKVIRTEARRCDVPGSILQDLRGLKIRIGMIRDGAVRIDQGASLRLTTRDIVGDSNEIQVQYPRLREDLKPGSTILVDDGLIQLRVTGKSRHGLVTEVVEGGVLKEKKGVNFPGVSISAPTFTQKDRDDLALGIRLGVDHVALSFVCTKQDVIDARNFLKKHGADIPVIAKIETRQALENIDDIIDVSDGLMIARGDLGVELPAEEVPMIQKMLIQMCNTALKPVIIATQMLESMTEHTRPTRAETTDVANGVLDGADALMLSAETSTGRYPVEAIQMMDRIIQYTETYPSGGRAHYMMHEGFAHAIAEAACSAAANIKARTIVAFSRSGFTALLVSKMRPRIPVTCFTDRPDVYRRMSLYWGVSPHVMKFPGNTDKMISASEKALLDKGIVKKGDSVAIIAASPFTHGGKSNIMKLHRVGLR